MGYSEVALEFFIGVLLIFVCVDFLREGCCRSAKAGHSNSQALFVIDPHHAFISSDHLCYDYCADWV
jgi:hypothetical protein